MSEFTVCRTLDTHPALRYCLLLDDYRIAGGKPDYRGDNILISWRTKETYGAVDALKAENAKLRELVQDYDAMLAIAAKNDAATSIILPLDAVINALRIRAGLLGIEVDE